MIFKVLIISSMLLAFGKVQEISNLKTLENYFMSNSPTIQSIKGRYVEESAKETKSAPYNDQPSSEASNNEVPKYFEELPSIRKKEPSMQFNTLGSNIKVVKNTTVESHKKELLFDSILIGNYLNMDNANDGSLTNLLGSYIGNEDQETLFEPKNDIVLENFSIDDYDYENNKTDNITRRFRPNVSYQPIVPGILRSPLGYNLPQNKPQFIDSLHENKQALCEKDENRVSDEIEKEENVINKLNPAKGAGIAELIKSRMMIMNHPRACYACSSVYDVSCWLPDRKTTVKYCREDHHSCVTKLYRHKGLSYIIRDCDNACIAAASSSSVNGEPDISYNTCTICHTDLCNRAYLHEVQNIFIVIFALFNLYSYLKGSLQYLLNN